MKILKKITVVAYETISIKPAKREQENLSGERCFSSSLHQPRVLKTKRKRMSGVDSVFGDNPQSRRGKRVKSKARNKPEVVSKKAKKSLANSSERNQGDKKSGAKDKNLKAPAGSEFRVINGPQIKDLKQLYSSMDKIDKSQFDHHTKRGGGNDFANWIENTLGDKDLAKTVAKMNTGKGVKGALEFYFSQ
jgi:hypothetical protein